MTFSLFFCLMLALGVLDLAALEIDRWHHARKRV
jgi:hypothetical protein